LSSLSPDGTERYLALNEVNLNETYNFTLTVSEEGKEDITYAVAVPGWQWAVLFNTGRKYPDST
jgi:hypothetical protein